MGTGITASLRRRAEIQFSRYVQALIEEKELFPLRIPYGKLKSTDSYEMLKEQSAELRSGAKEKVGYGYRVEYREVATRRYGQQSLPVAIVFEQEEDYLRFLGQRKTAAELKRVLKSIRIDTPELLPFLASRPERLLKNLDKFHHLAEVCRYFKHNPSPYLHMRELPLKVPSKFVEANQGLLAKLLPLVLPPWAQKGEAESFEARFGLLEDDVYYHVRLSDSHLREALGIPLTEFSVPKSELRQFVPPVETVVLLVENKRSFLAAPLPEGTIALWGSGFQAAGLNDLAWMSRQPIAYWGDLDVQGFEILSRFRQLYPQTVSFMMDCETLDAFRRFATAGVRGAGGSPGYLTAEEYQAYEIVSGENLRLEQEKLPARFVEEQLSETIKKLRSFEKLRGTCAQKLGGWK